MKLPSRYVLLLVGSFLEMSLYSECPYATLGLNTSASREEVKKAYRSFAKVYHPDNHQTGNKEQFQKYHVAYKSIVNPSVKEHVKKGFENWGEHSESFHDWRDGFKYTTNGQQFRDWYQSVSKDNQRVFWDQYMQRHGSRKTISFILKKMLSPKQKVALVGAVGLGTTLPSYITYKAVQDFRERSDIAGKYEYTLGRSVVGMTGVFLSGHIVKSWGIWGASGFPLKTKVVASAILSVPHMFFGSVAYLLCSGWGKCMDKFGELVLPVEDFFNNTIAIESIPDKDTLFNIPNFNIPKSEKIETFQVGTDPTPTETVTITQPRSSNPRIYAKPLSSSVIMSKPSVVQKECKSYYSNSYVVKAVIGLVGICCGMSACFFLKKPSIRELAKKYFYKKNEQNKKEEFIKSLQQYGYTSKEDYDRALLVWQDFELGIDSLYK